MLFVEFVWRYILVGVQGENVDKEPGARIRKPD